MDNSINKNLYYIHQKLLKELMDLKTIPGFEQATQELEDANTSLLNALSLIAKKTDNKELYITDKDTNSAKATFTDQLKIMIINADIADHTAPMFKVEKNNPQEGVSASQALKGLTPLKD